jgi:hypothetical protein
MTGFRRSAFLALLLALPIEAGNLCLAGMMLDPGPLPAAYSRGFSPRNGSSFISSAFEISIAFTRS